VADANDEVLFAIAEPAGLAVDERGGLLDEGVGGDHLSRHQIVADTEMLQRPLRLRSPELFGRDVDRTEAVVLNTSSSHGYPFARSRRARNRMTMRIPYERMVCDCCAERKADFCGPRTSDEVRKKRIHAPRSNCLGLVCVSVNTRAWQVDILRANT